MLEPDQVSRPRLIGHHSGRLMSFFSTLALHPPHAHLVGKGELDAFVARSLRSRLEDAVDRGCLHFTVDVSAVSFVDAGGLGALVGLRNSVAPYGGTITFTAASDRFYQVAELAGLRDVLDLDLLGVGLHTRALTG